LFIETLYAEANLVPLGEKLLNRNPSDFPVEYGLVGALTTSYNQKPSRATESRMLTLANNLIGENHDQARSHALMGGVYEILWDKNGHMKSYGSRAIAEYSTYLRLSSTDDSFRENALFTIRSIEALTPRQK